ncbi:MAG: hypothetical protein G01um10145_527 [Microgenomates group bacterium Gr01-1014_5]|nr:MAG: hypothetical protein G01um10145_527 [Microgenomates group bacterium Gr01-1014_5]
MYIQKLYKNGNSVAVTIPKQVLRELDLRDGTKVVVEKRGQEVVLKSARKVKAPGVDAKFMKMVDEFMLGHEDVLAELARK